MPNSSSFKVGLPQPRKVNYWGGQSTEFSALNWRRLCPPQSSSQVYATEIDRTIFPPSVTNSKLSKS